MIALIARDGRLSLRTHFAVDGVGIITELLQLGLHAGNDLIRLLTVGAVDRLVVLVIGVGIVTPGRIPPAVPPTPPAPVKKDDRGAMMSPPIFAVMIVVIHGVDLVGLRPGCTIPGPIPQTRRRLGIELGLGNRRDARGRLQFAATCPSTGADGVRIEVGGLANGGIPHTWINQSALAASANARHWAVEG